MDKFNKLTPAQAERLALLAEELGEAIQAIGKILRHGYDNYHPDIPDRNNKMDLEKELGHVECAIWLMAAAHDIRHTAINTCCDEKMDTISQWLHHS